jgi:hypothetical protein
MQRKQGKETTLYIYKKKDMEPTLDEGRRPSVLRRNGVIPRDREKTLRKNKKAWCYLGDRGKP